MFYLAAGSNRTSGTLATSWEANTPANSAVGQVNNLDSTSNNFHITGIQLELGTATEFQHETYAENLARCQRYFYKGDAQVYGTRGSLGYANLFFPVTMRATPTVTGIDSNSTAQHITIHKISCFATTPNYPQITANHTASAEL